MVSWSSISSTGASVSTILNTIGTEEAKFADVQGDPYIGIMMMRV